ncbi:MAG: hypothetical protein A2W27_12000 [Deltaproteobacteria bacterium RBG_16_44_11]|nr:MAG: hypothetical protein A2W27_12000 [Deltaproteobacteria bacterium RBG_16_44_11]
MFKTEKITKIRPAFVQHSFGLRFAAVIIRACIIKKAVKATMQISSAGGALRLPAYKKILRNFFITFVANVHARKNTDNAE